MANENSHLSGTVIQRTFVPEDLGIVLHIATVPIEDIYDDYDDDNSEEFLSQIVAETLAIPKQSIHSQEQYKNLMRYIAQGNFRDEFLSSRKIHQFIYDGFYYDEFRYMEREVGNLMETRIESNNRYGSQLALHSIGLMANPTVSKPNAFLFPFGAFDDFRFAKEMGSDLRNISRESLETGFACISSNINPDEQVTSLINEIQKYEIPSGQSPETKSESLTKLISNARAVCIAPIIAGSTIAATHLGQGGYVAALLDVTTGAAATLILVSSVSFAEVIARKLAEKRGRIRTSNTKRNSLKTRKSNKRRELEEGKESEA
jgi:hypothetical protein